MAAESFVYKIVALTVFVLIAATVLVPVVQDANDTIATTGNNTNLVYNYVEFDGSVPDITLSMASKQYYINDELKYADLSTYNLIVVCDNAVFRFLNTGTGYMNGSFSVSPYSATASPWELKVESGNATVTFGADEYDLGPITYLYYPDPDGNYGVVSAKPSDNQSVHLDRNKTGLLVSYASIAAGNTYSSPFALAEYQNGEITQIFSHYRATGAYGDSVSEWNVTVIDDSDPRNQELGGVTIDYTSSTDSGTSIETFWIVPVEYHYLTSNDSSMISLMNIIPLMVFIAAIMIAVAMLKGKS